MTGIPFILSAPAGTGKTSLIQKLTREHPRVIQSISFTSRSPRTGEKDGVHYHFINREEFQQRIKQGEFLEHVELYGDYYGTSRQWVEQHLAEDKHVFLVIDTQGALQLRDTFPGVFIFILPPSIQELERRLKGRKTESPEALKKRLAIAEKEISLSQAYDYLIVNDNFDHAYEALKSIVIAEEHRKSRFS